MSIDLEAIEARANAATPGPWGEGGATVYDEQLIPICHCMATRDRYKDERQNADFIAHAREDIPALLAEVKRQAAEIAVVTAERDAAVEDLRKNRARKCDCCAYAGRSERWPCVDCQSSISNYGDGWKWSGAGKEQNDGK